MSLGPFHCHSCGTKVELSQKPGRADDCPKCGADLRCCLNCELYDASLARGCRETQADEVRDVDRANFCGWFVFRIGLPAGAGPGGDSRAAFQALFGRKDEPDGAGVGSFFDTRSTKKPDPLAEKFKKPERHEEVERAQATAAFEKLFKR